jgi:6-phosphogluconate dehydrogenase
MTNIHMAQRSEIGMIGLGVMGRNFLLNMANHGFPVAGYDTDLAKVNALRHQSKDHKILAADTLQEFVNLLRKPCAVILLVPAGAAVDSVINQLLEQFQPGDLIIDAGNSYFKDTDARSHKLSDKGIHFLGVGISGGEEGALNGPSIMPGGSEKAYGRVRHLFETAAAKVSKLPCVTYLGPGSAGHFVKMIHNGIEYAVMQLISETYDLLKRGLNFSDDQLHDVYNDWNNGDLNSYLLEITSKIFTKTDEKTGKRLIDEILDVARQKGTGMWTSQSAMELQVPIPTIDIAVSMRDLSAYESQREKACKTIYRPLRQFNGDKGIFLSQLHHALYTGTIIAYAQGMAVLAVASEKYRYHLNLEEVARIWRGGCIIRSALLKDIQEAFHMRPDLPNLLLDTHLSQKVLKNQEYLRYIVCQATELGIPIPGFMASLGYIDAYRSSWLPANLVQAQRDYFGAHTYERVDTKGTFHTDWASE